MMFGSPSSLRPFDFSDFFLEIKIDFSLINMSCYVFE